jgi:hypothetical protein
MRRREFIALLGGAAASWPLAAHAQQRKLPTIGFLGTASRSVWSGWVAAFVQRVGDLGWVEGRTVTIEYRWAEGRSQRFTEIAAEFVRRKVDLIVTGGAACQRPRRRAVCLCRALLNALRTRINTLALGARLPTSYNFREPVEVGGFMSYGANVPDLFRRAGDLVDKILRGAKPAELPVEQPTKFDLVINLTTATALGLTIPEAVLLRADEVIE